MRSCPLSACRCLQSQRCRFADALNFFNNWFVTGDYAVAGVGLKNTGGVGAISMSGVPCTNGVGPTAIVPCAIAERCRHIPVAAFLYWANGGELLDGHRANGVFDGNPITGRLQGSDSSSTCWVTAPKQTLRAYRADVLRFRRSTRATFAPPTARIRWRWETESLPFWLRKAPAWL